jgi:16S rRNA (adenine1518-N6/adenine1519-N6)-dimethyltransferase
LKRSKSSTGGAKKRFGQHFLEPAWVTKLVQVIDPRPTDVFLEIGPGRGALTSPLADGAAAVVAIEIDRGLAAELAAQARDGLTVIEGDFLELPTPRLTEALSRARRGGDHAGRLRVAANLPYNVGSPILVRLVDQFRGGLPLHDAVVMLQREVADRLLAEPGTSEFGVLTVIVRRWARIERLLNLPPGAFRPAPKVRSTVLRLTFHQAVDEVADEDRFRSFVQMLFTRRRKTLRNALLAWNPDAKLDIAAMLVRTGLDGQRRPETFTVQELTQLFHSLRG